jgi:hypothetical protein
VDSIALQVVEQLSDVLPQEQLVDLSVEELDQVGAGTCDPGIIIIEK